MAGAGISLATMNVAPGYFQRKIEKKKNRTNDNPHLLVVFIRQLEILVTTLNIPGKDDVTIVRQMINGQSTIHILSYLPWWRYYFVLVVTSSLSCLIACCHILYNLEWMLLSIIELVLPFRETTEFLLTRFDLIDSKFSSWKVMEP